MRHIVLGLGAAVMLAGCGDPLRDVARLNDVAVSDSAATVTQSPAEARTTGGGLFGRLLNRQPDDPTNAAVEAALESAADSVETAEDAAAPEPVADAASEPTERRGGFLGIFGGTSRSAAEPDRESTEAIDLRAETERAEPESVAVSAPAAAAAEPERERRGLAGLFRRSPDRTVPRNGPDAADVPAGTVMPFGEIARVCGLRANEMGRQVDAEAGYRIFDTIPNSTSPRPFYITGFDDDCARTFTGAVVVTGDVETHEFVRYRPSNERIGYTTTDNAYEALKASVCRVGRGQPCGERRTRLDRNTQFVTVYNFFGGTFSAVPTQWAQILVHDGEVLAMSIKDGG